MLCWLILNAFYIVFRSISMLNTMMDATNLGDFYNWLREFKSILFVKKIQFFYLFELTWKWCHFMESVDQLHYFFSVKQMYSLCPLWIWFCCLSSGRSYLRDPNYNKGLAFSEKERDSHYLRGLLPPVVVDQELQVVHIGFCIFLIYVSPSLPLPDQMEAHFLTASLCHFSCLRLRNWWKICVSMMYHCKGT